MKTRTACFLTFFFLLFLYLSCSSSQRGVIVLCAGDSLTESPYPRFLKKIFISEGIQAKVVNYGQNGHTTGEYLGYLQKNREFLAEEHPDFICILLGTNDVRNDHDSTSKEQFYTNMKDIIAIFSQFKDPDGKKSRILLSTIPPIPEDVPFPFSPESQDRVTSEINPLILKIGKEENLPVVDNTTLFINEPGLLPEVHPTEEGYRRMAHSWFKDLQPLIK